MPHCHDVKQLPHLRSREVIAKLQAGESLEKGHKPDCLNCSRDSRFLCARAATSDVVDASVVLGAGIRGDALVTSGRSDRGALRDLWGMPIEVVEI